MSPNTPPDWSDPNHPSTLELTAIDNSDYPSVNSANAQSFINTLLDPAEGNKVMYVWPGISPDLDFGSGGKAGIGTRMFHPKQVSAQRVSGCSEI